MTGFDSDSLSSKIEIDSSTVKPVEVAGDDNITINYEFDDTTLYKVRYWKDGSTLKRELTTIKDDGTTNASTEDLLENVEELQFTYGVDTDEDKALNSWAGAGAVNVVAVRVRLTARPQQLTAEDQKMMSPRTLETAVTLRNLCMR